MNMTDRRYLIETMSASLVSMLMSDMGMDLEAALDAMYNSDTYEKLTDDSTGLLFQNPGYVYCYLKNEMLSGKIA